MVASKWNYNLNSRGGGGVLPWEKAPIVLPVLRVGWLAVWGPQLQCGDRMCTNATDKMRIASSWVSLAGKSSYPSSHHPTFRQTARRDALEGICICMVTHCCLRPFPPVPLPPLPVCHPKREEFAMGGGCPRTSITVTRNAGRHCKHVLQL